MHPIISCNYEELTMHIRSSFSRISIILVVLSIVSQSFIFGNVHHGKAQNWLNQGDTPALTSAITATGGRQTLRITFDEPVRVAGDSPEKYIYISNPKSEGNIYLSASPNSLRPVSPQTYKNEEYAMAYDLYFDTEIPQTGRLNTSLIQQGSGEFVTYQSLFLDIDGNSLSSIPKDRNSGTEISASYEIPLFLTGSAVVAPNQVLIAFNYEAAIAVKQPQLYITAQSVDGTSIRAISVQKQEALGYIVTFEKNLPTNGTICFADPDRKNNDQKNYLFISEAKLPLSSIGQDTKNDTVELPFNNSYLSVSNIESDEINTLLVTFSEPVKFLSDHAYENIFATNFGTGYTTAGIWMNPATEITAVNGDENGATTYKIVFAYPTTESCNIAFQGEAVIDDNRLTGTLVSTSGRSLYANYAYGTKIPESMNNTASIAIFERYADTKTFVLAMAEYQPTKSFESATTPIANSTTEKETVILEKAEVLNRYSRTVRLTFSAPVRINSEMWLSDQISGGTWESSVNTSVAPVYEKPILVNGEMYASSLLVQFGPMISSGVVSSDILPSESYFVCKNSSATDIYGKNLASSRSDGLVAIPYTADVYAKITKAEASDSWTARITFSEPVIFQTSMPQNYIKIVQSVDPNEPAISCMLVTPVDGTMSGGATTYDVLFSESVIMPVSIRFIEASNTMLMDDMDPFAIGGLVKAVNGRSVASTNTVNGQNEANITFTDNYKDRNGSGNENNPTPTPIETPEPEVTPLPTITPEPEVTPLPMITPEPEVTPLPTETPETSVTPLPTETPETSVTPLPTETMESSVTPLPTVTMDSSVTPLPTVTMESSVTPLPTVTMESSVTPLPEITLELTDASVPDTEPPVIIATEEAGWGQTRAVQTTISDASSIAVTKWAAGEQNIAYFSTAGETYDGQSFIVSANGIYTIFAIDAVGNVALQTINVQHVDTDAPTKPSNLAASAVAGTFVSLQWDLSTDAIGVATYQILCNNVQIGITNTNNFQCEALDPLTAYTFTVIAMDAAGNASASSDPLSISTILDVPANIRVSFTGTSALIEWDAVAGATSYDIEFNGVVIADLLLPQCTIDNLDPFTKYTFKVHASIGDANSDWSAEQEAIAYLPVVNDIITSQTFDNTEKPYVFENDVRILAGVTLTINPGVIMRFRPGVHLIIDGTLSVNGQADNRSYMTAINDINLTTEMPLATEGYWGGLVIGSTGAVQASYLTMRFARDISSKSMIQDAGQISIANSDLQNTHADAYAIYADMSGLNEARLSQLYAVYSGGNVSYNNLKRIAFGGVLASNLTIQNNEYQYVLTKDFGIAIGITGSFTNGVVVLGDAGRFSVAGNLSIVGSSERKVVLTSLRDTDYGGSGVLSATDYWKGIYIASTGSFFVDYLHLCYAYDTTYQASIYAATSITLRNSVLEKSLGTLAIVWLNTTDVSVFETKFSTSEAGLIIKKVFSGVVNKVDVVSSEFFNINTTGFSVGSFDGIETNIYDSYFHEKMSTAIDFNVLGLSGSSTATNCRIDSDLISIGIRVSSMHPIYISDNDIRVAGAAVVVGYDSTLTYVTINNNNFIGSDGIILDLDNYQGNRVDHFLAYDNVIQATNTGISFLCCSSQSNRNMYIFNNKIYADKNCVYLSDPYGSPAVFTLYLNFNILMGRTENSSCYGVRNFADGTFVNAENNFWGSLNGPSTTTRDRASKIWYNGAAEPTIIRNSGGTKVNVRVEGKIDYSPWIGIEFADEYFFGQRGGYAATGLYSDTFTDISVETPGIQAGFTRTYNSLDTSAKSFGTGWTFGFEGRCETFSYEMRKSDGTYETIQSTDVLKVYLPDGSLLSFTRIGGIYRGDTSDNTIVANGDGSYTLTTKAGYVYQFDTRGYLVSITDNVGNTLSISVNEQGKVQQVTDAVGRVYQITYNADGTIAGITDPIGRTVTYTYENGRLKRVTDPMNIVRYEYIYDASGFLSEVKDVTHALSKNMVYIHDGGENDGKVQSITDSFGNTTTLTYDLTAKTTTKTDSNGRQTIVWYNEANQTIRTQDAAGISQTMEYRDNSSNPWKTTDRNGNTITREYDANNNLIKVTYPDNSTVLYTYDAANNRISETDEVGKKIFYIYDAFHRLIKKAQPLNGTDIYSETADQTKFAITTYVYYTNEEAVALEYRAKGLLKQLVNPNGAVFKYTYDQYGNMASQSDPETDKKTMYQRNAIGWLISETTPLGHTTTMDYDLNGRLLRKTDPLGNVSRNVYNDAGQFICQILPNQYDPTADGLNDPTLSYEYRATNVGTRFTYNASGLVEKQTNALDQTVSYTYDLYGNVVTLTNPDNTIVETEYDVLNRVINKRFRAGTGAPLELLSSIRYTINSDKTTSVYETKYLNATESLTLIHTYDFAGREISTAFEGLSIPATTTKYNKNGTVNLITASNGAKTYYRYDGLNRPTEVWTQIDALTYAYTLTVYDNLGQVIRVETGITPVGLWSVPSTTKRVYAETIYYANGLTKTISDRTGRTTSFFYDDDNRMTRTEKKVSATESRITEIEYDANGRVTKTHQLVRAGDIEGYNFSDNTTIRLTTSQTYDKNGNVISLTNPAGVQSQMTYDALNRLVSTSVSNVDEYGQTVTVQTSTLYRWDNQILESIDANGNKTEMQYDARGRVIRTIDANGGVSAQYYDNGGRVIAVVSPLHFDTTRTLEEMNRTEYLYDTFGRVITVTQIYFDTKDNLWKSFVEKGYKYDVMGNKIKELGAMGYAAGTGSTITEKIESGYGTEFTYNYRGQVLTVLDAVSKERGFTFTVKYTYDALGRMTQTQNSAGVINITSYDAAGNIIQQSVKLNASSTAQTLMTATYDYANQMLTQTDALGRTTSYTWNALGQTRTVTLPGDTTIAAITSTTQYTRTALPTASWTSAGVVQAFVYDNLGHLLSVSKKDAAGNQAITKYYRYDQHGNLRFATDGNGTVTEYTYNALHQLLTETTDGHTTSHVYDANGKEISVTDWLGNTSTNVYDALNRLIERHDAAGVTVQTLTYDDGGRQLTSTDALGQVITYTYDRNDRLLTTTNPAGKTISVTYDNLGNKATVTDARGYTTTYGYDYLGRLTSVKNALNETTTYTYDLKGNVLSFTDAAGHTTILEYNCRDLLTRRIYPGGRSGSPGRYVYVNSLVTGTTYTAEGQIATRTDRNGQTESFTYDIHGNLLSRTIGTNVITYTYDNNANLLTMTDGTGTTTRTYDAFNRVLTKTVPNFGTSTFVYDITTGLSQGQSAERTADPDGNITLRVYDRIGRLIRVENDGLTFTYTYNANGSLQSLLYPGGAREDYTYTNLGQIETLINYKADGTIIDQYSYAYDDAGNLISKTDAQGVTSYTFDAINRLASLTEPSGKVTAYTYDGAGNRATQTVTETTAGVVTITTLTYTYDALNRLTCVDKLVAGVQTEKITYTYDNNGNQLITTRTPYTAGVAGTPVVIQTNTYDLRNQLIRTVTENGTVVENVYNGDGLRVAKTVNGATTHYLYEYQRVVLEKNSLGDTIGRNVYGTNLLMREVGVDAFFYMYNAHADVTALLTTTGTVAATYNYDPFGNVINQTGNANNTILFAGYQYDPETGLYYLNARMYDPTTARFLQEDTYTGQYEDPLSLNLYTYCYNSPLRYYDPTGHNAVTLSHGQTQNTDPAYDNPAQREMRKAEERAAANEPSNSAEREQWKATGKYNETTPTITEVVGSKRAAENNDEVIIVSASEYQSHMQKSSDPENMPAPTELQILGVHVPWNQQYYYLWWYCLAPLVHEYGSYIDYNDRYKYNFIEPAIAEIRKSQEEGNKNITWMISSTGYSDRDIENFTETAEKLGVKAVFFSDGDEMINYINTGDTQKEEGTRKTKIKSLSVFGHGLIGSLSLGYNQENSEELRIDIADIKDINPDAFAKDSSSSFYTCNSATPIDVGKSDFAQEWAKQTGSVTMGFYGKTEYTPANYKENKEKIKAARQETGYDQNGEFLFPVGGELDDDSAPTEVVYYDKYGINMYGWYYYTKLR